MAAGSACRHAPNMKIALFIGYRLDWHLNEVLKVVERDFGHKCILFDPSRPFEMCFDPNRPDGIMLEGVQYSIGCVWWRWKPYIDNEFRRSGDHESYQNLEWNCLLKSIWLFNEHVSVHKYDNAVRYNEKLIQTNIARSIGFKSLESICTNKRSSILQCLELHRHVVKPLRIAVIKNSAGEDEFLSTSELTKSHLNEIEDSELVRSVTYIQSFVDKKYEVRLNYIFGRIFARIFSKSKIMEMFGKDLVDWRYVYEVHNRLDDFSDPFEPNGNLIALIEAYVRATGLNLICFDFVSDGNDLFFLEANPDGQWGWLGDQEGSVGRVAEAIDGMMVHGAWETKA
ncbi:hypothetical protein L2D00_03325 [Hyphomonadaceae bacterium BL14]|nr:hypothetical protein L2D00_03325 [Hyphomonadaceae bacterium BL14]